MKKTHPCGSGIEAETNQMNTAQRESLHCAGERRPATPFSYNVVWEKDGMNLHSDQFGDEDAAKSYASFRRHTGSRKTEIWRQYQYRDELGATITNETMIEEWPFK